MNNKRVTYHNFVKLCLTVISLTLIPPLLFGQVLEKKISGTITDENGEALPGVSIVIKNTYRGTASDSDGNFTYTGIKDEDVLVVSFMGFITEEIPVSDNTVFNIVMKENIHEIQEVVAVGYGTSTKSAITSSIETIDSEAFEDRPARNAAEAMQGIVPGLTVSRTSIHGGKPGISPAMTIRGSGNPYVLIDGIEGDLAGVNPLDIESITVLKDAASSAIYGAKAAYGVILVTLKKGKTGARVEYSANLSISSPTTMPKMANSYDWALFMNEASVNSGGTALVSMEVLERIKRYINFGDISGTYPSPTDPTQWANTEYANANTDWFDVHIKDRALQQIHNISVSGKGNIADYHISGSWLDQEGILEYGDDDFKRETVNLRLRTDVNDWLQLIGNSRISSREVDMPTYLMRNGNMWHRLSQRWPTNPVTDPNGHYMRVSDIPEIQNGGRTIDTNRDLTVSAGLIFEPVKDWVTEINYDWVTSTWEQQEHVHTEFPYHGVGEIEYTYGQRENNFFSTFTGISDIVTYRGHSTYTKKIDNGHNFKVMVGYQQDKSTYNNHALSKTGVLSADLPAINTADGVLGGYEQKGHSSRRSYFGRVNYDYKQRYLFTFNWRADGSSYYQDGKRWGSFPSLSLGWNIAKENFWEPFHDYVNMFKLRSSYGSLGAQAGAYSYLETYSISKQLGYIINNERPDYVAMPSVPSPDLTWETVSMLTFGLDAGLFRSKLGATFEWWKRNRTDVLGPAAAPPAVYGANVPNLNNAEYETKGWEIALSWSDRIGDWRYNLRATLSDYNTYVVDYYNPTNSIWSDYAGKKVGEMWGFTSYGLIQSEDDIAGLDLSEISDDRWYPGDVLYEEIKEEKTGQITRGNATVDDHGDLSIIGNWMPRFHYGLDMGISWKNFDFSMFWQGIGKKDAWLHGNFFWGSGNGRWQTTAFDIHLDYWTPENTDAYYPRPSMYQAGIDKNQQASTLYMQDASYLRLKNVQLGYTLPAPLTEKVKIKNLKIYISAENILTFTKLPETFDPEALGVMTYGSSFSYASGTTYPMSKEISLGINITF